ncbi:MAG: hypothetical protein Q9214_005905, partial [Letrouitia sp. 1 TL-2023]
PNTRLNPIIYVFPGGAPVDTTAARLWSTKSAITLIRLPMRCSALHGVMAVRRKEASYCRSFFRRRGETCPKAKHDGLALAEASVDTGAEPNLSLVLTLLGVQQE